MKFKSLNFDAQEPLSTALEGLPARVLRLQERSGLIRARLFGARHATGKILTFLDAHCEVTQGNSRVTYRVTL